MKKIWADGAYGGKLVGYVKKHFDCELEIVKHTDDLKQFVVLPKRWIVERTFGWFESRRRLGKDHELSTKSSEGFIDLTCLHLYARRLAA